MDFQKFFFADRNGWQVERGDLRVAARIAFDTIVSKAEELAAAGPLADGEERLANMPLLAGTDHKAGSGAVSAVGTVEFLEAFYASKREFERAHGGVALIWALSAQRDERGVERRTGYKKADSDDAALYGHEVVLVLATADSPAVAEWALKGFDAPGKAHIKRPSGAQLEKERAARKAAAEEKAAAEAEEAAEAERRALKAAEAEEEAAAIRAEQAKKALIGTIVHNVCRVVNADEKVRKDLEKVVADCVDAWVKS